MVISIQLKVGKLILALTEVVDVSTVVAVVDIIVVGGDAILVGAGKLVDAMLVATGAWVA